MSTGSNVISLFTGVIMENHLWGKTKLAMGERLNGIQNNYVKQTINLLVINLNGFDRNKPGMKIAEILHNYPVK